MIRNLVTKQSNAGWVQLLLASGIASSLLLVPAVHAESIGSVPPPPPGPYASDAPGEPARFRPDAELEGAAGAYPPGMPRSFQDNKSRRLTRQEFMARQDERRKQMEQEFKARETEMQGRIDSMQKRMDRMATEDSATRGAPAPGGAPAMNQQVPSPEMQQQWEKRKAEQDKRWQQHRAEQDKRRQQMQAEREQRMKSMYRPESPAATAPEAATEPAQAPAAAQPAQAPAAPTYGYGQPVRPPAYGYGQPVRPPAYGYGYPPPPYGYGAPRYGAPAWGGHYSPYPAAPAAGAQSQ